MELKDILLIAVSLIGGGTGLAGLLRARGQNRVDQATQLTSEQVQFRAHMAAEIARLDAALQASEKREDELSRLQREATREIVALQTQNGEQARQIDELKRQNAKQAEQITAQAAVVDQLTGEKAQVIHQLQVIQLTKDFVEKENGELRREIERLKGKLPARVEIRQSQVAIPEET